MTNYTVKRLYFLFPFLFAALLQGCASASVFNIALYDQMGFIPNIFSLIVGLGIVWYCWMESMRKNRNIWIWIILGFLFGFVALFILVYLKDLPKIEEENYKQIDMTKKEDKTKDLKDWLQRTIYLEIDDLDSVVKCFTETVKNYGFKINKQTDIENGISIDAIFGLKIIAILINLIPFIGRNIPWGKRLGMRATIIRGDSINININISPYMELFNTSEVLVLSQTPDEKVTDEYLAAHKIHSITKELYTFFGLPIPSQFVQFNKKAFLSDIFLSLLIYPLDGYKATKQIHIPSQKGPKWSWPAFIIPEVWFVWNEIWGVSILAILLEVYGIGKLASYGAHISILIAFFIFIRIIAGRFGNIIYYYKYGRWIKDK